jgi:hypothetical protein
MKYRFLQTDKYRIKLDAAGEHLFLVSVAIYVAYLRAMNYILQIKRATEHLHTQLGKYLQESVL